MDRTLKTAKRKNKRRQNRNGSAWRRFSPDGTTCRYCKHDHTTHLTSSGQPHFYRPATEAEKRDPSVMLYRHTLSQGGSVLVRRMVVANHAELVTAFCTACAERWSECRPATGTWQSPPEAVQRHRKGEETMPTEQTLFFTCPHCDERFAQVEEPDRDIHTGETYHCGSCGIQVVFQAVTVEDYVPPRRARRDCHFCNPEPCRFGPSTDTTDDTEKGETT